jgi:hypothetical protein
MSDSSMQASAQDVENATLCHVTSKNASMQLGFCHMRFLPVVFLPLPSCCELHRLLLLMVAIYMPYLFRATSSSAAMLFMLLQ